MKRRVLSPLAFAIDGERTRRSAERHDTRGTPGDHARRTREVAKVIAAARLKLD